MNYQPRYLAYAKAHNMTPEAMLTHDEKEYPGGKMCGFILWISAQVRAFALAHPEGMLGGHVSDHVAFTRFLTHPAQ